MQARVQNTTTGVISFECEDADGALVRRRLGAFASTVVANVDPYNMNQTASLRRYVEAGTLTVTYLADAGDTVPLPGAGAAAPDADEVSGASVTAEPGQTLILTNGSARTVALPAAPTDGAAVTVKEGSGTTAGITVHAAGSDTFEDGSASFDFASAYAAFTFRYTAASGTWWVF